MLFWAIMGPPWASEKGPGWSNMTYIHVIYPVEVFQGHLGSCSAILSHSGPFWYCYGPFWGPRRYPNGPRVVQYNIYSCNIPMGSVLRSVGAFQGNIWSVAPFIPVGPSKNGLKNTKKVIFQKMLARFFWFLATTHPF